jgi:hypothetical protein
MRSGIRSKGEVIVFGGTPQVIEDHSWLHMPQSPLGINLKHRVHIFGHIDDHRNITGLSS